MSSLLDSTLQSIADQLSQGVAPWRKPWSGLARPTLPRRSTGASFSGMNAVLLSTLQAVHGYQSAYWLTYNQAVEAGGAVRRGEKGSPAILYKTRLVEGGGEAEQGADDKVLRFLKSYVVFNADQIDDLPERFQSEPLPVPQTSDGFAFSPEIARIIETFPVPVAYGGDRACYYWLTDRISMPFRASFDSDEDYVATLLHEFAHATGAKDRLDRFPTTDCRSDYAREELVAELASHLTSLHLGLNPSQSVFRNHVAYIESWAKILQDRPGELLKAAGKAQAASDFILKFAGSDENRIAA